VELIDFFRFNCYFAKEIINGYQPISEDPKSTLNLMRYRPLEGFIASISPFNFTAIAGNLAYTPAVMVNAVFQALLQFLSILNSFVIRETLSCGSRVTRPFSLITLSMRSSEMLVSLTVLLTSFPPTVPFSARPSLSTKTWPQLTSLVQCRKYSYKLHKSNSSLIRVNT